MKIQVLKSDGVVEPYLHTKILGTFHNALSAVNENDMIAAEQLAEAVTFHLYHRGPSQMISTDEIHLLIQSVLVSTGFSHAAEALNEYRLQRKLRRKRVAVISPSQDAKNAEPTVGVWDKSRIVRHLMKHKKMDRLTARTVAGAVEEKALGMGISLIRSSLIRELVAEDTEAMLRAEQQLQAVS
jgi:hypothetical protein